MQLLLSLFCLSGSGPWARFERLVEDWGVMDGTVATYRSSGIRLDMGTLVDMMAAAGQELTLVFKRRLLLRGNLVIGIIMVHFNFDGVTKGDTLHAVAAIRPALTNE